MIAAGVGFAALAIDAAKHGPVSRFERSHLREPGPAPRWAQWSSRTGDTSTLVSVTALVCAVQAIHRREIPWEPLVMTAGGALFRATVRDSVKRYRPPETWWREEPSGWSFPSRHTFNAVLAVRLTLGVISAERRHVALTPTLTLLGLVSASRVRLGVHWPSDVVGALLGGWFCCAALRRLLIRVQH